MSQPPAQPKVYHIVHVDRLASIITDGCLHSDAQMVQRPGTGTTIGMSRIKQRRLTELSLTSMPGLLVGGCVPFYFCPRSVMLFLLHRGNHPDLTLHRRSGPSDSSRTGSPCGCRMGGTARSSMGIYAFQRWGVWLRGPFHA